MRNKAVTTKLINPDVNLDYVNKVCDRDEIAQWIMNHCKKHPLYEDYFLFKQDGQCIVFHITQPSSLNGYRQAYAIHPNTINMRGRDYEVIQIYADGRRTSRSYKTFLKECETGIIQMMM